MTVIEVFADVACPFTHVGLHRFVDRRQERNPTTLLRVRAWPLELVNGEPLPPELVVEEVQALREQVAPDLFTGFDPTQFPETSLPAMAVAAAAYRHSNRLGERVSLALRHALFEQGLNISDAEVLTDIADAHHLTPAHTDDTAASFADWHEGQRRGVQGSPHFFIGDESFFCPTLEITRVGEHLRITSDPTRFEAFLARALPHT